MHFALSNLKTWLRAREDHQQWRTQKISEGGSFITIV